MTENKSTWYVHDYEDGCFTIYDSPGNVRAKFGDAATMAAHVAMLMEENDRLRHDLAMLERKIMHGCTDANCRICKGEKD